MFLVEYLGILAKINCKGRKLNGQEESTVEEVEEATKLNQLM